MEHHHRQAQCRGCGMEQVHVPKGLSIFGSRGPDPKWLALHWQARCCCQHALKTITKLLAAMIAQLMDFMWGLGRMLRIDVYVNDFVCPICSNC